MDGNNSNNKPIRCWGLLDLEEDEEALNVYKISKENINKIHSKTVGFNKAPEPPALKIENKKKIRNKVKSNATTSNDETKRQLASFSFIHNPVEENGDLNKSIEEVNPAQILKPVEEHINKTTEINDKLINTPFFQTFQHNQYPTRPVMANRSNDFNAPYLYPPLNFNPRINQSQMPYQNYVGPVPYFQQNPYLQLANFPINNAPRMVNFQLPNVSKTPYYERLDVIETLFKFIIQILRSPEQPPVEQIENIKNLLDSLVIKTNDIHLNK